MHKVDFASIIASYEQIYSILLSWLADITVRCGSFEQLPGWGGV
jgi:hypothetical protein